MEEIKGNNLVSDVVEAMKQALKVRLYVKKKGAFFILFILLSFFLFGDH